MKISKMSDESADCEYKKYVLVFALLSNECDDLISPFLISLR